MLMTALCIVFTLSSRAAQYARSPARRNRERVYTPVRKRDMAISTWTGWTVESAWLHRHKWTIVNKARSPNATMSGKQIMQVLCSSISGFGGWDCAPSKVYLGASSQSKTGIHNEDTNPAIPSRSNTYNKKCCAVLQEQAQSRISVIPQYNSFLGCAAGKNGYIHTDWCIFKRAHTTSKKPKVGS